MSEISVVEIRMIGVIGLLVTAVVSVLLATGGVALGRLIKLAVGRAQGAGIAGMTPAPARSRCGQLGPEAGRAIREPGSYRA